jgi:hypothetical protein
MALFSFSRSPRGMDISSEYWIEKFYVMSNNSVFRFFLVYMVAAEKYHIPRLVEQVKLYRLLWESIFKVEKYAGKIHKKGKLNFGTFRAIFEDVLGRSILAALRQIIRS